MGHRRRRPPCPVAAAVRPHAAFPDPPTTTGVPGPFRAPDRWAEPVATGRARQAGHSDLSPRAERNSQRPCSGVRPCTPRAWPSAMAPSPPEGQAAGAPAFTGCPLAVRHRWRAGPRRSSPAYRGIETTGGGKGPAGRAAGVDAVGPGAGSRGSRPRRPLGARSRGYAFLRPQQLREPNPRRAGQTASCLQGRSGHVAVWWPQAQGTPRPSGICF